MKEITVLENFDIYETQHQIILIGSNAENTFFKILKISRWTSNDISTIVDDWFLTVTEDEYVYSMEDIDRTRESLISMTAAKLVMSSVYGIVGFVRFKQGYYMIVITKRSVVAKLAQHSIYKVDETKTIYLPGSTTSPWDPLIKSNDTLNLPTTRHPDEKRYLTLFQSVDLTIDTYFSYTYDLSNTIQYNLAFQSMWSSPNKTVYDQVERQKLLVHDRFLWNWSMWPPCLRPSSRQLSASSGGGGSGCDDHDRVSSNWLVLLIHGFVGQTVLIAGAGCVEICVLLVGRRSRHFAGTRFLKRGANRRGNVANEVETEQIVFEDQGLPLERSRVTSHVQLRGSIPLQWHQEMSKVMGKPPIRMTREDNYYEIAGRHFSNLLYRHGGPIMVLNLVKQREKHQFEGPLSRRFVSAINHLRSHFIEPKVQDDVLKYIEFDMARVQRKKNHTVLEKLAPIADNCIKKTGFFHSEAIVSKRPASHTGPITKTVQCGIVRTNCIDCLDRTNTAQFVIGQAAIGHQLHALGHIDTPKYTNVQSMDRMLQVLYEDHGNVLAMQYGGSELVHNIETYKKTAKLSTQSRDFVQTVSRYLTNKFSDVDKQMSINLLLGVYRPYHKNNESIWDQKHSDLFMHDRYCDSFYVADTNTNYDATVNSEVYSCSWLPLDMQTILPMPFSLYCKWNTLQKMALRHEEAKLSVKGLAQLTESSLATNFNSLSYQQFENNKMYNLYEVELYGEDEPFSFSRRGSHGSNFNGGKSPMPHNNPLSSVRYLNERVSIRTQVSQIEQDPVSHLTGGPVMTALRNEPSLKSISSESNSDEEDSIILPVDNTVSSTKKPDQSQMKSHLGITSGQPHYMVFVVHDLEDDLITDFDDCINSSAAYFTAHNLHDISTANELGHYNSSAANSSMSVCQFSQKLYSDNVQFGKTDTLFGVSNSFYKKYSSTTDFLQMNSSYLLSHL